MISGMVVRTDVGTGQLADLVKQVQAGNEVLLMQGGNPVARLLPASETKAGNGSPLRVRSLRGHKVLIPVVSQTDLAEEMFGWQ